MITHVFNANMYHLSPRLIRGLMISFKSSVGKIILLADGEIDRISYNVIFDEFNFRDFIFCPSNIESMINVFRQDIDSPILFHGGSFERWDAAFQAGCKNVNWICWGGDASKSSGRRHTQSLVKRVVGRIYDEWSFRKKKRLYKQFNTIVTLIAPDRQTIIDDFKIPANKIEVIPYRYYRKTGFEEIIDELYHKEVEQLERNPSVLIGNSPMNAPFYMQMLDTLKDFQGKIEVHCMYQYPHKKDDTFNNLLRLGKNIFGDDFYIDEEYMSGEDYIRYLNQTDIYVCSNPEQTGGAAILFLVLLGKKIYLTGKNYEYVTDLGCSIHNTNAISETKVDLFIQPDSKEVREHNRNTLEEIYVKAFDKWASYFKQIDSLTID